MAPSSAPDANSAVFLHVDMDAFYASVEQRDHPALQGKPVVVGAPPTQRGVVSAASYEARAFGIHSAMPSPEAGRLCPHAVFIPPDMERYERESARIFSIFERYTPLVEALSIDEAFLDVSGSIHLFGSGERIARKIKADVFSELSLTCSVGVAPNKFLAKLGSEYDKPNGLTIIPFNRKGIVEFLRPLSVTRLWGVGKVTRQAFDRAGLYSISDVQDASPELLKSVVGPHSASHLKQLSFGDDPRAIELDVREKSISREHTFLHDERARARVESVLLDLVEDVSGRLRADGRFASVGRLKIRWKDFETITRQRPFPAPTRIEEDLRSMAQSLLREVPLERPVRLVGFGVSGLSESVGARQLDLFDPPGEARHKKERLDRTVDQIRVQHGPSSIRRARTLPPNAPSPPGSPRRKG